MAKTRILVALCGETFPQIKARHGNFEHWFINSIEAAGGAGIVWNAHAQEKPPEDGQFSGCIVTGSPAMVTDRAKWSVDLGKWLIKQIDDNRPVLGVCYGHQLIADALGGEVDYQPGGREIGSLQITLTGAAASDPLFANLPECFFSHLTHGQSVMRLPEGAVHLAGSHRATNQAFRYGGNCWGLQFHPEFSADIMAMYIDAYESQLTPEQKVQLPRHMHDCEEAESLLHRFVEICSSDN